MQKGDGTVVVLIIAVLAIWAFYYIRGKMRETVDNASPFDFLIDEELPDDDATRLLEENGYEVTSGKKRIPIEISVNDGEMLHSRLFIDYMASKNGLYYTVKLAKDRKPVEWTGSSIRERLLVYQLVYPNTAGVLYVDLPQRKVHCFVFAVQLYDE